MKALSIDWLQLNLGGAPLYGGKLTAKKLDYSTRHFKIVEEIYYDKKLIGVNARSPHSKIIKPDTNLLKFDNKFLYEDNFIWRAKNIIAFLNLELRNISRIDIAIDLHTFLNNLKPQNLITNFINNKYIHNGRGKYKVIGEQKHGQEYSYLRFGNPISDISVYLYDKKRELNEQTFKQYIFNKWKAIGLDVNKDIWRLEISIKSNNLNVINLETGETERMNFFKMNDDKYIEKIYYTAIQKYFQFKHNNGQKNKSRMNQVRLFKDLYFDSTISFLSEHSDYNRTDKIFLRKLEELNQELRGTDFDLSVYSQTIINKFIKNRRLTDYYVERILN